MTLRFIFRDKRWTWALGVVGVMGLALSCGSPGVEADTMSLNDRVEVYEDAASVLSIDRIADPLVWDGFRRPRGNLNSGLTQTAFWVRLKIDPTPLAGAGQWIVSTGVNLVEVEAYATGETVPPFNWNRLTPIDSPPRGVAAAGYELPALQRPVTWVIFRAKSDRAFLVAPRLSTLNTYEYDRQADGLRSGAYYGLMLGAIVYNLFLALWLRDHAYVFYVLFEIAFCATVAEWDRAISLAWPLQFIPPPEGLSERLMVMTAILAVFFARSFLDLRTRPRMVLVARVLGLIGALVVLYPTSLGRRYFIASGNLFVICASLQVSFMALYSWRRGNANAPLFVLGWGTLLLVIIGGALMNLGAMAPRFGYADVIRVGSATEAMMLAAALAKRISALKRAEADARAALAEARLGIAKVLERQLVSLHTLVGGVAHEIGNPLNFAAGGAKEVVERLHQAEALSDELERDWAENRASALRDVVAIAHSSAALAARGTERIGGIVKNLRAYVGALPEARELINLDDTIRATMSLLDGHLRSKAVAVELDLRCDCSVSCRAGEMSQVVMNLALNACQAMPEGGKIHIVSERRGDALHIIVSDTGPGIPSGLEQAIFDPFFTTRAPNHGTGLGLSVSREIVRRHGGTLELLPPLAGRPGARFAVTLPLS